MKIKVLDSAKADLKNAFIFYENQRAGLGGYFLRSLQTDIDKLKYFSGIHPVYQGFFRALSHLFPFAIYYKVENNLVAIYSILDCRSNPDKTSQKLK